LYLRYNKKCYGTITQTGEADSRSPLFVAKKAGDFMKGSEEMDWNDIHLLVASAVYAIGGMLAWIYIMAKLVELCDDAKRAQLKKKVLKVFRNILRKFIKVES
jgi:hypothetical protein